MKLQRAIQRLSFRDLELLSTVAAQASMAKAAARLNMTQSGVSRAIAKLEDTLGVPLVERSAQGVILTAYGHSLMHTGQAILADLRYGSNEIDGLANAVQGDLRIGCTEPMTWGLVPEVVDRLLSLRPGLRFQIILGDPDVLQRRDLLDERVDLVIGALAKTAPSELVRIEHLWAEDRFVVAGASSAYASNACVTLHDLADAKWVIAPEDSPARATLEAACRQLGLTPPKYAVETFSIPILATLVSTGGYVSVLPESMLRFSESRFSLARLPIDLSPFSSQIGITVLRKRNESPLIRLFLEQARALLGRQARDEWK